MVVGRIQSSSVVQSIIDSLMLNGLISYPIKNLCLSNLVSGHIPNFAKVPKNYMINCFLKQLNSHYCIVFLKIAHTFLVMVSSVNIIYSSSPR